jgi:hypothetical protein
MFVEPVTPRVFKIKTGIDTEVRFNLGHGPFSRLPDDANEIRIGLFSQKGNFWSEPLTFPVDW